MKTPSPLQVIVGLALVSVVLYAFGLWRDADAVLGLAYGLLVAAVLLDSGRR